MIKKFRIENRDNPIGPDIGQPRFGWQLFAERRNVQQTTYEIQIASDERSLVAGKKQIWTSGKTNSDAKKRVK